MAKKVNASSDVASTQNKSVHKIPLIGSLLCKRASASDASRMASTPQKSASRRFGARAEQLKVTAQADGLKLMAIEDLPTMMQRSPQNVYDAYIMNLSGTLFKGDLLMPGVDKIFSSLGLMRRPMYFMSSNSHTTSHEYQEALARYGMNVDLDHIFTPVRVAIEYLEREFPSANIFAICDDKFRAALREAGISLTDDPECTDVVLVAHDRDFNFAKLNTAFHAITGPRRAKLLTTSMVRSWPTAAGDVEPGTRAIVRAIESSAQTRAIRNLGTPESAFLDCMFEHVDFLPRRVLLVSDSLSGDIRMAKHFGMPTALVLTGEASLAQAQAASPKDQPHFVLDSVAGIVPEYIINQL